MHFVIYAFSSHVEVLHSVTPIDLLAQSAVLSDGVVFCVPTIFILANRHAPSNYANHLSSTCKILCVDTTRTQTASRGGQLKCRLTYWFNRRYVLQNFNLIACRTLQNTISALRHQIMVTVNEMDRMRLLKKYRHQTNLTACAVEFMKTLGADLHIRPKVPFCTNSTALRHQIMVTVNEMDRMRLLKKYRHQTNLTACAIEFIKTLGADLHIRPKVPSCTNSTALRHQIMVTVNEMDRMRLLKKYRHQTNLTACAIEFMKMVGADLHIRPKVPFCTNSTALRHQIMVTVNEMDRMRLLKKYRHQTNLTACAIEFMKTVGADLHIRPKVPSCTNSTALRHQIMVTVNEMDRMDCLYRHNPLGRIYKSAPTRVSVKSCRHDGAVEKVPSCIVGVNCLVQNHHNHPVRLRLPPLHRRGMY